ncbi:aminotransferase class V-fold PLP-dependent enzyme [Wohlfahrtiimonas chitiniclastica]|uniref:Cysteine desulfurase n=1 Tax=Wohlfahrtiimonas chitiniclastica TaxID=400946 RepID=A0AB35C108_9GAMM|nr:cysteine desulfurase [Wohlfahrtiimonas chitiniclastica]MBS7825260.1 cysteine desulfurase [Wohlfahrtiimonas chitiniclastica]MBS7838955.1 cysteine desulfurase [Wohlfahrtiimonas chitiniclastica]MBS7840872.1 cysteine desulfurase [Wohlfahrtiimonas chitiniclastica]
MSKIDTIRQAFPILSEKVHDKPVVFLDTGASAQKPTCVIEAEKNVYEKYYANIHRGVYFFSQESTERYENVRKVVCNLIGSHDPREIIFTKGTTESINLVAHSLGGLLLKEGDQVMITEMEHHANIVPWQMICQLKGAHLLVVPVLDDGSLDMAFLDANLTERVKIVAVTQISNVLGTINDIATITQKAHAVGAKILVDGAQGIVHEPLNVSQLDVDFYVFSAHKLYGPTGVGVVYGKKDLLNAMPPYQTGGDMIDEVTFEKTTFAPLPNKFEAGTPNIAGVIAFEAAIKFVQEIGFDYIAAHEKELLDYATEELSKIPEVRIIGTAPNKVGVISFVVKGVHPHDIGTMLDHFGVAVRVGHHCAQPIMRRFGVPATARMSFGMYNTKEEVDQLIDGLKKIIEMFS